MTLFKDGDKAILVQKSGWGGIRNFYQVWIHKVHKTGRLTLTNDKEQWKFSKGWRDERDSFVKCGGFRCNDAIYVWDEDLIKEIKEERRKERSRQLLNLLGEYLTRVRDKDEGEELWSIMPDEVKQKIKKI